jgi:D-alanine-D-alanine ligase
MQNSSSQYSQKQHITLLCGGQSDEYDVSLKSATQVMHALDRDKYEVTPVVIAKENGYWLVPTTEVEWSASSTLPFAADRSEALSPAAAVHKLQSEKRIDVALLILHGQNGEDGVIQGFLETCSIPYTGSGVAASSLCMEKGWYQEVIQHHGFVVPQSISLDRAVAIDTHELQNHINSTFGFPCFVKPVGGGSSVGTSRVMNEAELDAAIELGFQYSAEILVQELIQGEEVTCGVLEIDGAAVALPVTAIRPKNATFFDYSAKYTPGATEEITPAPIDEALSTKIQHISKTIHELVGCRGMSRTDLIIENETNRIVVLETNTIPGMTETSLLPQGAAAIEISFSKLLDYIITAATTQYPTSVQ